MLVPYQVPLTDMVARPSGFSEPMIEITEAPEVPIL